MVVSATIPPLAQDTLALKAVWANVGYDSCPYHYNFHLHTHCSDGQMSPQDLMRQALDIGLKGLAITDHHSIEGYRQAQIWLENEHLKGSLPHLWTGVEITANLLETEVHILGYGFDPTHTVLTPYLQRAKPEGDLALASRVINSLQQAGALVVLARKPNKLSLLVVNINYSPPVAPIPTVNLYYSAFSLIAGLTVKYLN